MLRTGTTRITNNGRPAGVGVHPPLQHAMWFAAIAALAFLIPYVLTSVLDLPHDLYYAAYFLLSIAAIGLYAEWARLDVRAYFTENWLWSIGLGLVASVFVV